MAPRWVRRGLALAVGALAANPLLALESPPRRWSVEVGGAEDDLRGRPLYGSGWTADASGNLFFLVRRDSAEFGEGIVAGSLDPSGALRWQRDLAEGLGLLSSDEPKALQLEGGATVFATSTYEGLVVALYDGDGQRSWVYRAGLEPSEHRLHVSSLTGGAEAGIFLHLWVNHGGDGDATIRVLQLDLQGRVVIERNLSPEEIRSEVSARFLGSSGDRNIFLEDGNSRPITLVARSQADGSEAWRTTVFDEPGRGAWIRDAVVAADGTVAVLGGGSDWDLAGLEHAPGDRFEPIFEPDYWEMFAVAKVGADGELLATHYEALPRFRDLGPQTLVASSDGGVYVGAIQDYGSRDLPQRPVVFAYDAALQPRWRQVAWSGESGSLVALAALADGGVAFASPQCNGEDCRTFLVGLSPAGRVRWSALGAPCPSGASYSEYSWIALDELGGALRLLVAGPGTWGGGALSLESYSTRGALDWSRKLPARRAIALDYAGGLAPVPGGGLVLAARSGYEDLLVEVGPAGTVDAYRRLPGISQSRIRAAPGGGTLLGGSANADPQPDPQRPDFLVAEFRGPDLEEAWRSYAFGSLPGETSESAQDLEVGGGNVCLSGTSSRESDEFLSESRVSCWGLGGEKRWSRRVGGPEAAWFVTALAVSTEGTVAVASSAFSPDRLDLVAFDAEGRQIWERRQDDPLQLFGEVEVLAFDFMSAGDLVVVARSWDTPGRTMAFAVGADGQLRWSWKPSRSGLGPLLARGLAESAGRVLVAGCSDPEYGEAQRPYLAALEGSSGTLAWVTELPGPVDCYALRLGTDGCGDPMLAAAIRSDPAGGGVAVLSSAGEVLWADLIQAYRPLFPMATASDRDGGSWVEWSPLFAEDAITLTRYERACPPAP